MENHPQSNRSFGPTAEETDLVLAVSFFFKKWPFHYEEARQVGWLIVTSAGIMAGINSKSNGLAPLWQASLPLTWACLLAMEVRIARLNANYDRVYLTIMM